jgi:MFS family permease
MGENKKWYPWLVLILLYLNMFFAIMAGNCMPPLFSEILKDIPMTKAQMGAVMSMYMIASVFCAPIVGVLSDKIGCRWIIGTAAIVVAVAGGLRYFAGSATALFVYMFFIGTGCATFMTLFPKILGSWFPPKILATVNGICYSSFVLGLAVSMGTSANLLSPAFNGWRGVTVAFGAICMVMGLLWMIIYRDRQADSGDHHEGENVASFKKVFKIRDVWLLAFFNALLTASTVSLNALLPITLEEKGIINAGGIISVMMFSSLIFTIFGGILSDRVGKRKIFLIMGGIITGLCIPCLILFEGPLLILALIIAGAFSLPIASIMFSAAVEVKGVGALLAGTSVGLINMIGTSGGFIGPIIAGRLIDISGVPWPGFIFMAVLVIIAGLIVIPSKLK